jgi:hypothetical protein
LRDLSLPVSGKAATVDAVKGALASMTETRWSPGSTLTLKAFLSYDIWVRALHRLFTSALMRSQDASWAYLGYASLDADRNQLNTVASALADEEVYGARYLVPL